MINTKSPAAQVTHNIRRRLRHNKVQARVKFAKICGAFCIDVDTVTHDARFSHDDIKTINLIAKTNGLTWSQGGEIDMDLVEKLTARSHWRFEIPEAVFQRYRELDEEFPDGFRRSNPA